MFQLNDYFIDLTFFRNIISKVQYRLMFLTFQQKKFVDLDHFFIQYNKYFGSKFVNSNRKSRLY